MQILKNYPLHYNMEIIFPKHEGKLWSSDLSIAESDV